MRVNKHKSSIVYCGDPWLPGRLRHRPRRMV